MRTLAVVALSLVLPIALASCASGPGLTGAWRITEEGSAEGTDVLVLHPNHEFEIVEDSSAAAPEAPASGTWFFEDGVLVLNRRCATCGKDIEDALRIKITDLGRESMKGSVDDGTETGGEKVVLKRVKNVRPMPQPPPAGKTEPPDRTAPE